MKRAVLFVAIGAVSFAVTLWARGGLTTTAAPVAPPTAAEGATEPHVAAAIATSPGLGAAARPVVTRRVVEVTNEGLTEFQKLQLESPAEASALNNAVIEATAKARYERQANLEDCATTEQLPGAQALRFATSVSSDGQTFRAAPWRFVEVVDGSPVPPDVIACMERALGGPYAGARPDHATFPAEFSGDVDLVYRLQSFATPYAAPQ